ncbi:hypothetical protein ARMSODRAFT_454165 [Armillaria solidipes]|uniref:Uncharacterized protein n=1 Tax=Armillaria solidipes TaxID=1076256 RepID=A0A2H3B5A1_9AGAR|nr:hypothetical protein ARMSODRAFT_454165 [Armillaria solidipes]
MHLRMCIHQSRGHCGRHTASPVSSERPRRNEMAPAITSDIQICGGNSKVQTLTVHLHTWWTAATSLNFLDLRLGSFLRISLSSQCTLKDTAKRCLISRNIPADRVLGAPLQVSYTCSFYAQLAAQRYNIPFMQMTHVDRNCGMLIMSSSKWAKYLVFTASDHDFLGSGLDGVKPTPWLAGLHHLQNTPAQ